MNDQAHKDTDKRIKTVRNRLANEYKQAEKELKKKTDQYFAKFKEDDEEKRKMVKNGELSQKDYIKWRENKMLYGKTMQQNTQRMAEYLANVDQRAADIINGQIAGVYATNYNFASYQIEGKTAGASFTLHDDRSVARLAKDNPRLLPKVSPDKIKGQAWSRRKINNVITQGVLQGESIPDIAKGLSKVVGMSWNSAVRNARTAMTGAQNAGRLDSYHDAMDMGIKMKKKWMATLDERTRQSHADIDGEIVDVDETFSNGLMYPGDPDGDPAEVYNCRCTMVADLEDVTTAEPEQSFEEWMEEKKSEDNEPAETITKDTAMQGLEGNTEAYRYIFDSAEANNVEYLDVNPLKEPLSDKEIISKLAGGDMTMGSCVSLAMAYAGNVGGYDVLDFRGGMSVKTFAKHIVNKELVNLNGVVGMESMNFSSVKGAKELISKMENDKLYMLVTGKHASIVKIIDGNAQYLELQSALRSGWHPFEEDTLRRRFGCTRSRTVLGTKIEQHSYAIDVDSLSKSKEFHKLLGYINTEEGKQRKGTAGHAK